MPCRWRILQDGSLPLRPDGRITSEAHACTSTLVWHAGDKPSPDNSVVIDPCFAASRCDDAARRLSELGVAWEDLRYYLETHRHYDHVVETARYSKTASDRASRPRWVRFEEKHLASFPGVEIVGCPGHAPDLRAFRFDAAEGETWIVGDAIIDRRWLVAWMFYWPNGYEGDEIVQTWRTVAQIIEKAKVVVPGHGPPIRVDAELLRELLEGFPRAMLSRRCPEVAAVLERRLASMGD
ncbi:MAG: MBL fold metallo-hydrolase [Planctomycetota bacterium]|jgi:glyoxylase-like metal-dependent hydrolase (beta-lactamase superfamily II)